MQATVLSIAGSDPTGGAGIQADLKTMTSIGVYGAAAVTCITVQNSFGVSRIECLTPDLVAQQIQAVLDDHHVTHIKIGMVGSPAIAEAIHDTLAGFHGEIIYDPVMASSTGQPLLGSSSMAEPLEKLISRCTVLTPNLPELSTLTHANTENIQKAIEAARQLLQKHAGMRVVLIKGGHLKANDELIDSMVRKNGATVQVSSVRHPAVITKNSHGTGCTLASAFASFHCLSGDDEVSFHKSINYIQDLLRQSAAKQIIHNQEGLGGMLHHKAS